MHKHCITSETLTSFTVGCEMPVKKLGVHVYIVKVESISSGSQGSSIIAYIRNCLEN